MTSSDRTTPKPTFNAGIIIIGLIGLLLDGVMRLLEGLKSVRWRYAR